MDSFYDLLTSSTRKFVLGSQPMAAAGFPAESVTVVDADTQPPPL